MKIPRQVHDSMGLRGFIDEVVQSLQELALTSVQPNHFSDVEGRCEGILQGSAFHVAISNVRAS